MVDSKIIQDAQNTEILRSQYLPDEMLGALIKNRMIATNIRSRRGRKVEINVPVFRDEKTSWPFCDPTVNYGLHRWPEDSDVHNGAVKENCIYMDNLLFGVGSCCLQVTMQAQDIDEARTLHDQLLPLGPIMLALTAATPVYKGFLVDTDVRWNQNGSAMDDRTAEELGEEVNIRESLDDLHLLIVLSLMFSRSRTIDGELRNQGLRQIQHISHKTRDYEMNT